MPLDINGYDSAFKTFVKFAQHRSKADMESDVANATVSKAVRGARSVMVGSAGASSARWLARDARDMAANDQTRGMTGGEFDLTLLYNTDATDKLDVAPNGETTPVAIVLDADLNPGIRQGESFAKVRFTQKMTIDLLPDVPVITSVKLGQKLGV